MSQKIKYILGVCPICGGRMEGDGYTRVRQCENYEEGPDGTPEPDANPRYCKGDEPVEE